MRTVFLITARLKSTRLPRKVIQELAGKPVIVHMLDRVKRAKRIAEIVVCTSTNPQDDPLCEIARREDVRCFRGSENDVLDRLYQASRDVKAEYLVNATADNPLVDPDCVDRIVEYYHQTTTDYLTASQLPRGTYAWGVDLAALEKVCAIKAEMDTEVWGDYFTKTGLFRVHDLEVEPELQRPELRLTLDYPEDLRLLRAIFDALYVPGGYFTLRQVIQLLDARPDLVDINRHCEALYRTHLVRSAPMKLKPEYVG